MLAGAPRRLLRFWQRTARGGLLAMALVAGAAAGGAAAQQIATARYIGPTTHYAHGILGDAVEFSGMMVEFEDGGHFLVSLGQRARVFEDVAPRLWDVTGDDAPEIVVIETDPPQGAQLAIYGVRNGGIAKIAATPHIGRTHRWLAPIGAADLDGDGVTEVAYIDRPHLAKTLRIWRFADDALTHAADFPGLTNHRIGEDTIAGGIRDCGDGPEMILATANWSALVSVTWNGDTFAQRRLGTDTSRPAFARALNCAD